MESKIEIYQRLEECRQIVRDKETGTYVYSETWREVDRLLDFLNDLNALQNELIIEELTV